MMKIGYLTRTMNPRTGIGIFSIETSRYLAGAFSNSENIFLTSDDLLPPNKWQLLRNFWKIRKALAGCDIVHALDGFPYGVIAILALLGTGVPVVITAVGTGGVQKLSHPIYGPLLRFAYRRARAVVAFSTFIQEEIRRLMPSLKTTVIWPGVDFLGWQSGVDDALPGGVRKPYILSVGYMKRRKGYHISIPAFARIKKVFPEMSYVIVGDPSRGPEYYQELQSIIKREGIEGSVSFIHGLTHEELRALYHGAELFILLSQNVAGDVEGFGLVFLEAAACGLPVIGSRGTGAGDAVLHERNGFLVTPDSIDEAHDRAISVLRDNTLREQMSSASRHFAESLSWGSQTNKYAEIYRGILGI